MTVADPEKVAGRELEDVWVEQKVVLVLFIWVVWDVAHPGGEGEFSDDVGVFFALLKVSLERCCLGKRLAARLMSGCSALSRVFIEFVFHSACVVSRSLPAIEHSRLNGLWILVLLARVVLLLCASSRSFL
jgi:hypothetical protein